MYNNGAGSLLENGLLKKYEIIPEKLKIEPFTMVIFGGGGDLSRRRLLPALFELFREGAINEAFSIIGYGMPEMDDESYRRIIKHEIGRQSALPGENGDSINEDEWKRFSNRLYYQSERFEDDGGYIRLRHKLDDVAPPAGSGRKNVIYYMAISQDSVPVIVEKLKIHRLHVHELAVKVVLESPFGRDRLTAERANRILHDKFDERLLYRIEHNVCRETVQNILYMRFVNTIFEPVWNARYIDNVQVTVAEDEGIEHHGTWYEHTGVARDTLRSSVLQILGTIAMEMPARFDADGIRDEKVRLYRSIRKMDAEHIDRNVVTGQYGAGAIGDTDVLGYREEKYVDASSVTPTFVAAKIFIDNHRWSGVPFYVRTGKRLPKHVTEICLQFRQPEPGMPGELSGEPEPNVLVLGIRPREKITIHFGVKYFHYSTKSYPVNMSFDFQDAFKRIPPDPYKSLLIDCLRGDQTLFMRDDAAEAMWAFIDPIVDRLEELPAADFPNYSSGSWGPRSSKTLLERDGRRWITR